MTNWYQSFESLAMEDGNLLTMLEETQRKTEFQASKMVGAIGGINWQLNERQAQSDEFFKAQKEHKAQLARLDKWHQEMVSHQKSSYLQLKSMSAMASDIHRELSRMHEGGVRCEESRPNSNAEAENLNPNLPNHDLRRPPDPQEERIAAEKSSMLEIQRVSERNSSLSSGNRGVVVEEFNKLGQSDDVEAYTKKFEELRTGMLSFNPSLSELYFVTSYISGLKAEIKNLVKLSRPKTLAAAYEKARLHYDAIQALISDLEEPAIFDIVASEITDESSVESFDSIEIMLDDLKVNSIECLADSSAYNVFDEMPKMKTEWNPLREGTDLNLELKSNPEASVTGQEMNWHNLGRPPEESEVSDQEIVDVQEAQTYHNCFKVISIFSEALIETNELVDISVDWVHNDLQGKWLEASGVSWVKWKEVGYSPFDEKRVFDPGGVLGLKIIVLAFHSRRIVEQQRLQWDPGGIAIWNTTQQ